VLQQNSLPNFLEAAPSGGSFQKIGCAIVFAQALSIIDTLGDRQSNYSACMVERDALHHTFYRFSPRFARAETAVLNKTETEEGSDRRAIAPFFG
jgi:hypothetical protein